MLLRSIYYQYRITFPAHEASWYHVLTSINLSSAATLSKPEPAESRRCCFSNVNGKEDQCVTKHALWTEKHPSEFFLKKGRAAPQWGVWLAGKLQLSAYPEFPSISNPGYTDLIAVLGQ